MFSTCIHLIQIMGSDPLVGATIPGPGIILWVGCWISSGYKLQSGLCCTNEKQQNGGQCKGLIFRWKCVYVHAFVCVCVFLYKKVVILGGGMTQSCTSRLQSTILSVGLIFY